MIEQSFQITFKEYSSFFRTILPVILSRCISVISQPRNTSHVHLDLGNKFNDPIEVDRYQKRVINCETNKSRRYSVWIKFCRYYRYQDRR